MPNSLTAVVGNWYRHLDKGGLFQVTATDTDVEGSVEVQSFDGDLDEFTAEEWRELEIAEAEEPEDWTGPYDGADPDDLGYSDEEPPPAKDQPQGGPQPLRKPWDEAEAEDE